MTEDATLRALGDWLDAVVDVLRTHPRGTWRAGSLQARADAARPEDETPALKPVTEAVRELVRAVEAAHVFRRVVEDSGDVVLVLDAFGRADFVSSGVTRMLGWQPDDLRRMPPSSIVHAADLEAFLLLVDGGAEPTGSRRVRMRRQDGAWRVVEWTRSWGDHDPAGSGTPGVVVTGRDVTERERIERELVHQATHDALTGLPNRSAIMALMSDAVRTADAATALGVVMIDLDRFKEVNDSLGHAVGDRLLGLVGERLRACLRPGDVIARLGGDEFAVLLPMAAVDDARLVADRLSAQLDAPFVVDGMDLHVEASFGIAVTLRGGDSEQQITERLMREADIAMYRAKEAGLGIAVFDPERDTGQNRARLELAADLRRGVSEGQLVVHYQPVVAVVEGALVGVEALVRWQHPERGLIPPSEFLPLAEQSGLVVPLSRVVLRTAVAQAAAWLAAGRRLEVAVNLSPRWLQHGEVPDVVAAELEASGLPPEMLRLEITESVVLGDPESSLPALERLRAMGVGLSLDDFGTGFSSMTHLRRLPVDQLKVDRGFVAAMTTSPEDAVIVRTAVELGHNLGMRVVAEGIEDADTLAEIVASGCPLAQGYYFSRPLPAEQLQEWADTRFPVP